MPTATQTLTGISTIVGSGSWTPNPATVANLNTNDANYNAITGATKNTAIGELDANTFGFDAQLPATVAVAITDVTINARWKVSTTGSIANLGVAPRTGGTTGTKLQVTSEPTADTLSAFTAVARPGGGAWTRADLLDATFSVRLYADQGNSATSVVYSFGYIEVVVTYDVLLTSLLGRPFGLGGGRQMHQLLAQ